METFLIYLIKASLVTSVCCILFLLLKTDKHFGRNRLLLVSGLALSFLIPLMSFSTHGDSGIIPTVNLNQVVIGTQNLSRTADSSVEILPLLFSIYLAGMAILLFRLAFHFIKLIRLLNHSVIVHKSDYILVLSTQVKSPFSFFNLIFMNENINQHDAETILTHELAHQNQWHSFDIIFTELVIIFQWFNPAAWYYKKLITEVHEYQADSIALNHGVGTAAYLQLLFATALNVQSAVITNSFCQIKLKRRIKMITKKHNSRMSGLKFAAVIAAFSAFAVFVSCNNTPEAEEKTTMDVPPPPPPPAPPSTNENPTTAESPTTGDVYTVVEQMPEFVGGDNARVKFLSENIKYPELAKEKGIMGTVFVSFVVDEFGTVKDAKILRGIGGGCDEEALRVVKLMPKWKPGKQSGKPVNVAFNMPIKFMLS